MTHPRRTASAAEPLEARRLLATFLVTTTLDSGQGSLREAIAASNATSGVDDIAFAIGSGPATIAVLTPLPQLLDAVSIDGTTQPGFAGTPLVTIDGGNLPIDGIRVAAPAVIRGLRVTRFGLTGIDVSIANGSVIEGNHVTFNGDKGIDVNTSDNRIGGAAPAQRNLISGNGGIGVDLSNSGTGNVVAGNYIGTDATGAAASGNGGGGVRIVDSGSNTVGGTSPGERNVISGNAGDGVRITGASSNNRVIGNYIGLTAGGAAALPNTGNGVTVFSANNFVGGAAAGAGNVISGNRVDGVRLSGAAATGNVVAGNYIGTDATGAQAVGNGETGATGTGGVRIVGASNNLVGGTTAGARNVISGNLADGLRIDLAGASGNAVQGNYIGTDATGAQALGNRADGIQITFGGHTIGGVAAGAGNVISGNLDDGIELQTTSASGNFVRGNRIGVNAAGDAALANGSDGIEIQGGTQNVIGGTSSAARNVISGNNSDGIEVLNDLSGAPTGNLVQGNLIGATFGMQAMGNLGRGIQLRSGGGGVYGGSADGGNVIAFNGLAGISLAASDGNEFSFNSIFANGGLGIDLLDDGVTANDALDADAGPNGLQNHPVILSAERAGSTTLVRFALDSAPNQSFQVDVYASPSADPTGFGEGATWLGRVTVTTDAAGHAEATAGLLGLAAAGQVVTATATDAARSTSEFSAALTVAPDTTAPRLESASFAFDDPAPAPPHRVLLQFSEDVGGSLAAADFSLVNLTTGATIPPAAMAVAFAPSTNRAAVSFPGLPGAVLPDGNYVLSIDAAGVIDPSGNPLLPSGPFSFFVLAGDANRDRRIDIADFSALAARFNLPGTFSQGDFNYSGVVDIGDFSILAGRFNQGLPPARAPLGGASAAAANGVIWQTADRREELPESR